MRRTVWLVALVLAMSVIPLIGVVAASASTDPAGSVVVYDPVGSDVHIVDVNGSGGGFTSPTVSGTVPGADTVGTAYLGGPDATVDDVLFYSSTSGRFRFASVGAPDGSGVRGLDVFVDVVGTRGWSHVITGDYNGDGTGDVLFYRARDGLMRFYTTSSSGAFVPLTPAYFGTRGWTHLVVGDYNSDGADDVMWYRARDGLLRFYEVAAGGVFRAITPAYFGTRNWSSIPAGDYNGDGSDDVLFYRGDGLARFYEVDASGAFRALGAAFSPSAGFTQIESVEFTPGTAGVDLAWYHAGADVLAATRYNTNGVVNLWAPRSTVGYGDNLTIATGVFPRDTTKPVITVTGGSTTTVAIDSTYTDRGATATDDVDGNITDTIVTINNVNTAAAGKYTVTYDVSDAAGNPADQKTRTVYVVPLEFATQNNHFLAGYKGPDLTVDQLTVPSVDPAGITFGPSDHLFIVDSEIDEDDLAEVWTDVGEKNVFEVSSDGSTLHGSYALPGMAVEEPTGIAYHADGGDEVFYVTNDSDKKLYRYLFTPTGGFTLDDSVSTSRTGFRYPNVEGVTVDTSGNIYVMAEGKKTILVYTYSGGFVFDRAMDLAALNPAAPPPRGPEGVAFDAASGNLFVVSQFDRPNALFEYTTAGAFVGITSIKDFDPTPAFGTPEHNLTAPKAPQGITFGPATSGPSPTAFYLTDGGTDNGTGAVVDGSPELERDGVIYEGRLP